MLFNSFIFLFLLMPISIVGYYAINKLNNINLGTVYLLAISLWFIAYMNIMYVLVLIPSIVINYLIAYSINTRFVDDAKVRKVLAGAGIAVDVLTLLLFKYFNFFVTNINKSFDLDIATTNIILPLGISFYTFQQITYIVDCLRDPGIKYNFLDYALYICFYPQFVQGPIVLQSEFMPQLHDENRRTVDYEYLSRGMYRFILGLAKKVIIADSLAGVVNIGYQKLENIYGLSVLLLILAYTMQIYFDFSGYSDMAIGLGQMLHFDLPENFDSPYKACSISEFWDRWHITLTRFFTRYVYIPLGGSRKGQLRTYTNILLIFLLSGLWHGADWSFVAWGALHGVAMVIDRLIRRSGIKIPRWMGLLATFIFVDFVWVFFVADNLDLAMMSFNHLIHGSWTVVSPYMAGALNELVEGALICRLDILCIQDIFNGFTLVLVLVALICICEFTKNTRQISDKLTPGIKCATIMVGLGLWSILSISGVTNFIYWNF